MLSDCAKCWETPCRCGHNYQSWSSKDIADLIKVLAQVLIDKTSVKDLPKQETRSNTCPKTTN